MESKYSEVRINHFDDIEGCWCVDAWLTPDDNEEGRVIAKIKDNGEISWIDKDAESDPYVKEEFETFLGSNE